MSRIQKDYEGKVKSLKSFGTKTAINHKFANQYMQEQFKRLKQFRESILVEKCEWEQERERIFGRMAEFGARNRVISLDVGGTHHIKTNLELLTSVDGSLLQKMFSGKHDVPKNERGYIFLDRDGETFLTIVNYLRNHRRAMPKFDSIKQ